MTAQPKRELTLLDSTCLIVGIIIGVGIYTSAPQVASAVGAPWGVPVIWALGGLLSLFGALGYAELASMFPQKEGGDVVYLGRAYGRWAGFLFGWAQLVVVRPGDIVAMAFAAGVYGAKLYAPFGTGPRQIVLAEVIYAVAAVVIFTAIHVLGVRQGKWTQNALTIVKALGLLAIAAVALWAPAPAAQATIQPEGGFPLTVAMILVLFAYGGWNEMAYVAAEVREPRRNIVRALVAGTVAVTAIYLLVNLAMMHVLGYAGMTRSAAVATDVVSKVLPALGGRAVSCLICISALGAVNGLIFSGARISYAMGAEHRGFGWVGRWNDRLGTPARALVLQGIIAVALVLALGSFVDAVLYTAACVYSFYLATSLAVIVLRWREPGTERPYRVTGYPITTLLFCATCAFLIHGAVVYKPKIAMAGAALLLLGLPVYWWSSRGEAVSRQRGFEVIDRK